MALPCSVRMLLLAATLALFALPAATGVPHVKGSSHTHPHPVSYYLQVFKTSSTQARNRTVSAPPAVVIPSHDAELQAEANKVQHALKLYDKERELIIGLLRGFRGETGPRGYTGGAEEIMNLRTQLRELEDKMTALTAQHARLGRVQEDMDADWSRGAVSCPDGWKRVGFSQDDQQVHCAPKRGISPGNRLCRHLATFPKHYDRCGWSIYCQAPWNKYNCFTFTDDELKHYHAKREYKRLQHLHKIEVIHMAKPTNLTDPGPAADTPLSRVGGASPRTRGTA